MHCSFCHNSPPPSPQQFSDKRTTHDYDPSQTPRADLNHPFFVHDVNTANVFDETNPLRIARQQELRVGSDLARSSTVRVRLYDMRGRIVAETHWQGHPAGNVVALPAGALGSGLYECEIVLADGNLRKVIPVAIAQ